MEPAAEGKEFAVTQSGESTTVVGQTAAVSLAKKMSLRRRGRVNVERKDGRVHMQFRNGELLSYRYETGDARRRK